MVRASRKGIIACTNGRTGEKSTMPIEQAMEIEIRALMGRAN